jgi:hypothetical protein
LHEKLFGVRVTGQAVKVIHNEAFMWFAHGKRICGSFGFSPRNEQNATVGGGLPELLICRTE